MKEKEIPTINIKGTEYSLVKDRVLYFNKNYPRGCIKAKLISLYDSELIVIKVTIIPDTENLSRRFVDYAQEQVGNGYINKTSAMENCSTSAVGRALALMGIGVIDSIASVDEINKAENRSKVAPKKKETIDDLGL